VYVRDSEEYMHQESTYTYVYTYLNLHLLRCVGRIRMDVRVYVCKSVGCMLEHSTDTFACINECLWTYLSDVDIGVCTCVSGWNACTDIIQTKYGYVCIYVYICV